MAADDGARYFLFNNALARLAVDGVVAGVVRGLCVCPKNTLNGRVPRGFLYRGIWGCFGRFFGAPEILFGVVRYGTF